MTSNNSQMTTFTYDSYNTTTAVQHMLAQDTHRATYQTVIAVLFLLVIMATALIGNSAVVAVVCLHQNMRKEVSNFLIVNLCITDLSNTLLVMFSALVALITDHWPLGSTWCDCVCAINYCLIIVSMLTLCCISIDRYQAVMHPLSYQLRITRQRTFMIIIYTWIQGIAIGTAPSIAGWVAYDYWEAICAIQWHQYRPHTLIYVILAFLLCFLIPGLVLVYCYTVILKEVKKQKIQAISNAAADSQTKAKNKKRINDRSKLVWSLLVVVFAYFICTTPFSVTKLIKVIAEDQTIMPGPVNLTAALLGYIASAINPLIYGIFRRDFRKAYKNLICSVCLKKEFKNTLSTDFPSNSNIGTITHANNLTVNPEQQTCDASDLPLQTAETDNYKSCSSSPAAIHFEIHTLKNGTIKQVGENRHDKACTKTNTEGYTSKMNGHLITHSKEDQHLQRNGIVNFGAEEENHISPDKHSNDINSAFDDDSSWERETAHPCRRVYVLSASQPFDDIH